MSILILIAFVIMILSYQILQQFHKEVKQAGKQSSEIFSFNFNQSKGNELYNSYKKGIGKVLISVRIHQRINGERQCTVCTTVPYFPYFLLLVIFLIIFFSHINLNYAEEIIFPEVGNAIIEFGNIFNQSKELQEKASLKKAKKDDIRKDVIVLEERLEKSKAEIRKLGKKAVPDLEKVILDKNRENRVREISISLLIELGEEEVADTLIEVAGEKENKQSLRTSALWHTGQLSRKIKESNKTIDKKHMKKLENIFEDSQSNKDLKEKAFAVYGIVGQNDALPVLIKKLNDQNKEIVAHAAYATGEVRTPEGEEALFQGYLKNRGTEVEGLFVHLFKIYKIKKATPHIIESLKEVKGNSIESTAKRGGYINTLGELGDTTSVTILWEIVNNSDVSFNSLSNAEDAAISLAKFGDYEAIKKVIKKIEIDSRIGKGNEKGLRNLYKRLTGEDYNY